MALLSSCIPSSTLQQHRLSSSLLPSPLFLTSSSSATQSSSTHAPRRICILGASVSGSQKPDPSPHDSGKTRPSSSVTSALGSKHSQVLAAAAPSREGSASTMERTSLDTPPSSRPSSDWPRRQSPAELANGRRWDLSLPSKAAEPMIQDPHSSARLSSSRESQDAEADRRWGTLVEGGSVFQQQFLVRWYEVGQSRRATMESMANLLQEAGSNHAASVGFVKDGLCASPSMHKLHLVWVVTRMHVQMEHFPTWGDTVEVETYFQWESNISWRRDWIVRMPSEGNRVIGRGTSTWVMMNLKTRRLAKITDEIKAECIVHCPPSPRFCLPKGSIPTIPKHSELQEGDEIAEEFVFDNLVARRSDLDMHHHVNNVTYIGWMTEALPRGLLDNGEMVQMTLEYKRECRAEDCIESVAWRMGDRQTGPHSVQDIPCTPSASGTKNGAGAAVNGVPVNGVPVNGVPANGVPANGVPANGVPVLGGSRAGSGVALQTVSGGEVQIRASHDPLPMPHTHLHVARGDTGGAQGVSGVEGSVGAEVGEVGSEGEVEYSHFVHSLRLQGSAKDGEGGKEFCRGYSIWREIK